MLTYQDLLAVGDGDRDRAAFVRKTISVHDCREKDKKM